MMQYSACIPSLTKNRLILRTLCATHFLFLLIWLTSINFQWRSDGEEEQGLRYWLLRPSVTEISSSATPMNEDEWDWAKNISVVYTWVVGSTLRKAVDKQHQANVVRMDPTQIKQLHVYNMEDQSLADYIVIMMICVTP